MYFQVKSNLRHMWQEILDKFKRFPAQEKVIRLILQRGFQVNDQARVVSGQIEIPHAQIAKELEVLRYPSPHEEHHRHQLC